jgi:crotonobetainyl-CoA:carnitine CoA-transferase CaiB-like acyl-CoA transferase
MADGTEPVASRRCGRPTGGARHRPDGTVRAPGEGIDGGRQLVAVGRAGLGTVSGPAGSSAPAGLLRPLHGLRVVELGTGIAAGYAGRLLCDAGAEVVKVEPPGGDPVRQVRWARPDQPDTDPAGSPLFRYLAAGKRAMTGGLGDPAVDALVAEADMVVETGPPTVVDPAPLWAQPGLVVLSITCFGRHGPYAHRPGSEHVAQAESGSIASRGRADQPPVAAGGAIGEWLGAAYAVVAGIVALGDPQRADRSIAVDVALTDVLATATNLYADLMFHLLGRPPLPQPPRTVEFPSIEQTADSWVAFNTNAAQMLADFCVMVGRPDLAEIPGLRADPKLVAELAEATAAWCRQRSTDEIVELAAAMRIPAVPVGHGANLPTHPQVVARQVLRRAEGLPLAPRPPWRIDGAGPPPAGPPPGPPPPRDAARLRWSGSATGTSDGGWTITAGPAVGQPLRGLRVLDLTCWWAGPAATSLLAAFGADVVHVEATARMDGMRAAATLPFADRERWWEYSAFFLSINLNKQDVTLDLDDPRGLELAKGLVGWADVVAENYTPRVLEHFGLDWEGVHRLNPRATMVRMPAFGLDGPWRDRQGFAQTIEAMAGLAWLTGHPDGPMLVPRGPADPNGAAHSAIGLLLALIEARRDGQGRLVEVPLFDAALAVGAVGIVEHDESGDLPGRLGNRSPLAAPQGVYRCQGDEQWVALSVADDDQWTSLCTVLGRPDWAGAARLGTRPGRFAAHDELDAGIAAWAAQRDAAGAVAALTAAGVPAGVVVDHRCLSDHPHLRGRGFIEEVDHPVVGRHPVFSTPFRYPGLQPVARRPAPTLGQHNRTVLGEVLGVDEATLAELERDGVIGNSPR